MAHGGAIVISPRLCCAATVTTAIGARVSMTERNSAKINAFCTHDRVHVAGSPVGPLAGLSFAAKDIYDVAGRVACCGNPDWLATHAPAVRTAPAIERLLDAGASLVGMTITEELVMGLTGENPFYGAPVNVAAPGRVAGGSSSGSAAAVAAGLVDFALGSDTGGSVRVPASFCGIYGLRPTHGRIPLDGVMPFAPSLDTVGWFAREATVMRRVGSVLLDAWSSSWPSRPGRFRIAEDAFAVVDADCRAALQPAIERIASLIGPAEKIAMAGEGDLDAWSQVVAVYRESEGWQSHRDWIATYKPRLSDNGAMRMQKGARITVEEISAAEGEREKIRARMAEVLADGAVLAVPAAPDVAPRRGGDQDAIWRIVKKNARINAVAALAGLPQMSLPLADVDGLPIGLGLIAAPGGDEMLLGIAEELAA
jgi:amidase